MKAETKRRFLIEIKKRLFFPGGKRSKTTLIHRAEAVISALLAKKTAFKSESRFKFVDPVWFMPRKPASGRILIYLLSYLPLKDPPGLLKIRIFVKGFINGGKFLFNDSLFRRFCLVRQE